MHRYLKYEYPNSDKSYLELYRVIEMFMSTE